MSSSVFRLAFRFQCNSLMVGDLRSCPSQGSTCCLYQESLFTATDQTVCKGTYKPFTMLFVSDDTSMLFNHHKGAQIWDRLLHILEKMLAMNQAIWAKEDGANNVKILTGILKAADCKCPLLSPFFLSSHRHMKYYENGPRRWPGTPQEIGWGTENFPQSPPEKPSCGHFHLRFPVFTTTRQ